MIRTSVSALSIALLTACGGQTAAPEAAEDGSLTSSDGLRLVPIAEALEFPWGMAALPNGDFQVAIIPHTWDVTTLRELQPGSRVNLEIDMLARYVARMIGVDAPTPHDAEGAKNG